MHDHFNHGMPCNGQNVLSMTAAGMREPGRPASPPSSTGSVRDSVRVKPAPTASADSSREQPEHVLERHQDQAWRQDPRQLHGESALAHDQGVAQPGLQPEQDGWDDSNPDIPFAPIRDCKPECMSSRARHRRRIRKPHLGKGAAAQPSGVARCQDDSNPHSARQQNSQQAAARSLEQGHHALAQDRAQHAFGASPGSPPGNPLSRPLANLCQQPSSGPSSTPMSRPSYPPDGSPSQQSKPASLLQAGGLPPQTRFAGYQPAARGPPYRPPEHNPCSMPNNVPAHHRPPCSSMSAVKDEGDFKPAAHHSLPRLCTPLAARQAAGSSHTSRHLHPVTPIRLAAQAAHCATKNLVADDASGSPGTLSLCIDIHSFAGRSSCCC